MITRARDIVFSAVLLLCFMPLCIVIAVAIRIEGRGSVFYRSARVGLRGSRFFMLKFRTMHADGVSRLTQSHLEEFATHFKLAEDPRITRVGGVLRRTSLDEIPQLINIIMGDMALVGPRPKLPEEIFLYGAAQAELLSIRPGMTGYWQVHRTSANSDTMMREMDLYYVRHRSVGLDLLLLVSTPFVVFSRSNG
jgi:lipopolysaccharide/colanic/teichoic acid biosynthesis glycosyltransferase